MAKLWLNTFIIALFKSGYRIDYENNYIITKLYSSIFDDEIIFLPQPKGVES